MDCSHRSTAASIWLHTQDGICYITKGACVLLSPSHISYHRYQLRICQLESIPPYGEDSPLPSQQAKPASTLPILSPISHRLAATTPAQEHIVSRRRPAIAHPSEYCLLVLSLSCRSYFVGQRRLHRLKGLPSYGDDRFSTIPVSKACRQSSRPVSRFLWAGSEYTGSKSDCLVEKTSHLPSQ